VYLCIPYYSDACLKSSALRVGVKTFHNTILTCEKPLHCEAALSAQHVASRNSNRYEKSKLRAQLVFQLRFQLK